MHDFTPKEKKMREVKKEKGVEYKVFLFEKYQDKREWRRRREEGYTGYDSSSDSDSD